MSQSTEQGAGLLEGDDEKRLYSWLGLLGIGLAVGVYGLFRLFTEGTVVLGIDSQLPWGILVSTYEFFLLTSVGIVVGVVSLSLVFGTDRFEPLEKRGVLLALATLGAGLVTILVSLGRPERPVVHALVNANLSSPIWWVIVFAGAFGLVLVALLYLLEDDDSGSPTQLRALGAAGLLFGLGVAVAAGFIFGTAETRPYYGGALAPLYLVVTALLSGVAAIGFVAAAESRLAATTESDLETLLTAHLGKHLGLLAGATLFVTLVKAIHGLTATSEATALAYEHMLLGSFAPIYWGVGILVGLVVPLALMAYPATRTTDGVLAASAASLVGIFVMRYEFVVGGQVVALVEDPAYEYPLVSYTPSAIELSLVVFAVALCGLVYTIGSRLLELETTRTRTTEPTSTTIPPATGGDEDD